MEIIGLILVLIIAGVALYYIPMDSRLRTAIVVILILVACAWLLNYFGLWTFFDAPHRRR